MQKLKDFITLLKSDTRYKVFAAAVVLVLLVLGTCQGKPSNSARRKVDPSQISTGVTASSEVVPDLVRALKGDSEQLKSTTRAQQEKIDSLKKEMDEYAQRNAEIFRKMLDRMAEHESALSNVASGGHGSGGGFVAPEVYSGDSSGAPTMVGPDGVTPVSAATGAGMEEFSGNLNAALAPPTPGQTDPQKIAVVGAGDSVRVKLLSGINAPTDGTPYPIVLKLIGDIHGPDGSTLPLGEARLVAAAQGSLVDSRALFRLASLNLRYPDGRRNVIDVDGWVVGEDGLRGMEGILIDPIGKAIVAAGMAGGLQGLGAGMAARQTQVTNGLGGTNQIQINGSEGEFAAGLALQGATNTWSRIIENRVNRLVPQVQVLSGREGTAVFARSFRVPGLIESLEQDDGVYTSLD